MLEQPPRERLGRPADVDPQVERRLGPGEPQPAFDERQAAILAEMYRGTPLEAPVVQGLALRRDADRDMEAEQAQAGGRAASPKARISRRSLTWVASVRARCQ